MKTQKILNTRYYLIYGRLIGKREQCEDRRCKEWLYKDGQWVPDKNYVIMDHLVGFDPSEPPDSPYRIGSTSVLMEMDEITESEALSMILKEYGK